MAQKTLLGDKPLEADVLKSILEYLTWKRVFHFRVNSGAFTIERNQFIRFGARGCPDILAVYPATGLFWGIEVKRPGGLLSDAQVEFLRGIHANGGIATVAESVCDVEAVLTDPNHPNLERYRSVLGF